MVFAGYHAEMQEFLQANPGLRRRISHRIEIPPYSMGDLATILLQKKTWKITTMLALSI
jgi:hypothetical protein